MQGGVGAVASIPETIDAIPFADDGVPKALVVEEG
jgi:hypothetical protein